MYTEQIVEHFLNPRNVGRMQDPDAVGIIGDPACGDCVKMYLKIKDETIIDIKHEVFGCPAAIATTSIFTEFIKGRSLRDACMLTGIEVADALGGLSDAKMHCSNLAVQAFQPALLDYLLKQTEDEHAAGNS